MHKTSSITLLILLFTCDFSFPTLIHHDPEATSYQHIEMEHFHPVSTYIKDKDRELYLKNPVSLGKSLTNLEVHHTAVNHLKHPKSPEKSRNDIKNNHILKHPVYPSYQGTNDHILGLGAYSSDEHGEDYKVNEDLEEEDSGGASPQDNNYVHQQEKTIDDYKIDLAYTSNKEEEGSILEGTPEYEAYQKLAQAALLEYEQQIDPVYQHPRDRRSS